VVKPAVRRALLVAAALAGATGCNMILGIDEHELAPPDAATGSGGSGGAATTGGGQGGNAGQSGAAGQGATAGQSGAAGQGAAAGAGGNPPDDASAGRGGSAGQGGTAGQDGAAGQGGTAGQSGAAGQGGTFNRDAGDEGVAGSVNRDSAIGGGDADAAPPSDANTADVPNDASCSTPGVTECRGGSVFLCIGGIWVETQKCPYACLVNVCGGVCVPNSTQCTGNTLQRCDDTGTWVTGSMCPYVCSQGQCIGMCVPGTTVTCGDYSTCNDGAVQTCDFTGTLGACNPAPSNCETVPAGWQPVAKPASGTCPSGFGSPQTVYTSASGGPYTCSCNCGGSQDCEGTVTLNESTSCANSVLNTRSLFVSTTCTSGGYGSAIAGYGYTLSDVAFGPSPACFPNPAPTTQPPLQTTTMTLCTPDLTCSSGACLSPTQTANLCVAKQGVQACPSGFPNGTTFSPWYDDTRSCGACTCGSTLSCTLNGVLLDNETDCALLDPPYYMTATTSCSTSALSYPINYVKAEATVTGNPLCVETAPSTPMGSVELNQANISTVCCK
jgi:hypothetical protein